MPRPLRPISHHDRLSLIEHLTELRGRIVICLLAFVLVFGVCLWQSDAILNFVNAPLERAAQKAQKKDPDVKRTVANQNQSRRLYDKLAQVSDTAAKTVDDPELSKQFEDLSREAKASAEAVPKVVPKKKPVTLSVGEPLTATLNVAIYAALLISLPLLLYQIFAFILPAFSPRERQVAFPLMAAIPLLFFVGAAFGYFGVLPNAVKFLQNFNADRFDILLQARDYYRFSMLLLAGMGIVFQLPVVIIAITRLGILTPAQLRKHRGYAILAIAIISMLGPGTDPVSMLIAMVPLVLLYESSILVAALLNSRASKVQTSRQAPEAEDSDDSHKIHSMQE